MSWSSPGCSLPADAAEHLRNALHHWFIEGQLADLYLGFYYELHATPELLPWLLNTAEGHVGAADFSALKRMMND